MLGKSWKSVVIVEFTDSKIYEMPSDTINVYLHDCLQKLEFLFVNISFDSLLLKIVTYLHVLNRYLCCFFKDN